MGPAKIYSYGYPRQWLVNELSEFLVAVFRLPVYTIAGACLLGTLITSVVAGVFYHLLAPFYPEMVVAPDYMLGILMGLGGMIGMYAGARVQKFIPANVIKWILACILIFTGGRYFLGFWF
ncbi:MAG: sulfite exporter TauE/SafE family protein [Desulfobacteraceae bacterium]|nr:sulfite exporter TauE/SafE family protein [Desulfobacteraceae bacterium]